MIPILTVIYFAAACTGVSGGVISSKSIVSEYDYPRYAFNYAVNDPYTKDNKAQWEAREGNAVNGAYSLREPDGSIRVVEYSANDLQGFNAIVKNIGPGIHPIKVLTKTPIIPLAPITSVLKLPPVSISAVHTSNIPIKIVDEPINYGFGAAPLAIGLPKVTALGDWSLPWDPVTGSYGGWVPIDGPIPRGPYATIYSKKYVNGRLHQWSTGPIPLDGRKLIIKTTKKLP